MKSSIESPILSAGELLWDLLPSGPRLGGTTANFAIVCARLGDYVGLISRIGKDEFGRRAMDQLEAVAAAAATRGHFDLTGIQWSDYLPTGTVTVTLDDEGKPKYKIEVPVAWDEIRLSRKLLDSARTASAVCFGTLAQRQNPSRESIRALVEATSVSCVRVCDVNLRMPFCTTDTLEWCLMHASVLKISDEELSTLMRMLGVRPASDEPTCGGDEGALTAWALDSAQALLASAPQCRMVAITLGRHGSLLADRQRVHRHKGFAVDVVDTIGAGDAFTAGMVHAYVRGASLEQINTVSNLCGSYVASQPGATPELPPELLAEIQTVLTGAQA
jgi:fructokinase